MFDDNLPPGTVIGEFEIRRVLGYGGFGIVYEAYEPMLDRRVALKEYFLRGYSRRDGLNVLPANEGAAEMFNSGAARFVREARLLSMLNERMRSDGSLVAVYRVFQANGTAFMAMKLYEGMTLKQAVLVDRDMVTEAWLIRLLERLLDALHALHSLPGENLVHRDVSPDNIILQSDGTPVLLDFGATRKADDALTSLIFKPGYSPLEQYTDSVPLGPWTDLYALCGVAYFAVTGKSPLPAVDRHAGAIFHPAGELGAGRFSPGLLALIDHGMGILPEQRFRSCDELRAALRALGTAAASTQPTAGGAVPGRAADADAPTVVMARGDTATQAWTPTPTAPPAPAPPARTTTATGAATSAIAPAPAPSRRPLMLALGGGAAALLLTIGGWRWLQAPAPRPQPDDVMAASTAASAAKLAAAPSAPASAVAGTALVPGLACTAAAADWACVLDGLARLSTEPQGVKLRIEPARLKIGDFIHWEVSSATAGRLLILGVADAPGAKLVQVFPNDKDQADRMHANNPVRLPRQSHWRLQAEPPTGRSWLVAVVTPDAMPGPAALRGELPLADAVKAFADGRPLSLLGVADCTAGGAGGGPTCPKTLSIRSAEFIID